MSRYRDNSDDSGRRKKERGSASHAGPSPLLQAGIFGALGFQFVAVVLVSYLFGDWLDERYGTSPWGLLIVMMVGFFGTGYQTYRITKRFVAQEEEDSGD